VFLASAREGILAAHLVTTLPHCEFLMQRASYKVWHRLPAGTEIRITKTGSFHEPQDVIVCDLAQDLFRDPLLSFVRFWESVSKCVFQQSRVVLVVPKHLQPWLSRLIGLVQVESSAEVVDNRHHSQDGHET
jgi:hypothetical protein